MPYTLFFSRMRDGVATATGSRYGVDAAAVLERARSAHPGFLSLKTYVADDGERLSVVRFSDAESQRAWAEDPVHREAQARGRKDYYATYRLVVCEEGRSWSWSRESANGVGTTAEREERG